MSSTEQAIQIIDLIHTGQALTLSEALQSVGMSLKLFQYYLKTRPELAEMYDEAMQASYDLLADRLVHVDQYYLDPKVANVVSANIRWVLSKRKPSTYGDHSTIEHKLTADKDVLEALLRAKTRAQTLVPYVPQALPHPLRTERLKEMDVIDLVVEDDTDISVLL